MQFEKYLEKFLGLRVMRYAWGVEGQDTSWPLSTDTLRFRNESVQKMADAIKWNTGLLDDQRVKMLGVLKKIDDAYSQLTTITWAQRIIWKRIDILGTVTKIWDPKDPEYKDIIDKIDDLKKETLTYWSQQNEINTLLDSLKLEFAKVSWSDAVASRKDEILKILWISTESVKYDTEWKLILSQGTKIKINLSEAQKWGDVTAWRLIPESVWEITVAGVVYKRLWKNWEFLNNKKEFLLLSVTVPLEVTWVRTTEQLATLGASINNWTENLGIKDKLLIQKSREHWMDEERVKILFSSYLENSKLAWEMIDEDRLDKDEAYTAGLIEQCIFTESLNQATYKMEDLIDIKDPEAVRRLTEARVRYDRINNPTWWVRSTYDNWKNVPAYLKVLNDLFLKFTWIDLFWLSPQEQKKWREYMSNMIWWPASWELGSLSERFESDGRWSSAISLDSDGTWKKFLSYGTYQINRDKLKAFVAENKTFLGLDGVQIDEKWYSSDEKDKNPIFKAWAEKAAADPVGFKKLEQAFVKKSYFDPLINSLKPNVDFTKFPIMVQNVLWSTAVQHGEGQSWAVNIITKALEEVWWKLEPNDFPAMRKFVEAVYKIRGTYRNSTPARYSQEQQIVLAKLDSIENTGKFEVWTASSEELAKFMVDNNYQCFARWAQCWQNVWEMLLSFADKVKSKTNDDSLLRALTIWMKWRRDGYRYTEFFETPPLSALFDSRVITNPMQADKWGIVVYNQGFGIWDRKTYWHVEISAWGGNFYFGKVLSHPGWSINAAANPSASGFTWKVYYLKKTLW